jgi:hypothetical protein
VPVVSSHHAANNGSLGLRYEEKPVAHCELLVDHELRSVVGAFIRKNALPQPHNLGPVGSGFKLTYSLVHRTSLAPNCDYATAGSFITSPQAKLRQAKLRRSQKAANVSHLPKTEGAAAVG